METKQSIEIWPNGSRASTRASSDNFTGSVVVDPLFGASDHMHDTGGLVSFEPGARTGWHRHPAGQILIVTSGAGWVREWQAHDVDFSRVTSSGYRHTRSTGTAQPQPTA
jgi:quercetin dioxygenase-like cupin family protein